MDRKKPPAADSPAKLLDDAIARHQQGDFAGAVTGYRSVLQKVPGNIDASHLLGLALWQSGETAEGLDRVLAAAKAAPKSVAIQNNLGGMLMAIREFKAAEAAFRAALAVKPDHVDALSNLSAVLLELNRTEEAEKAARQALAVAPNRADAWSNRGVALLELGRFEEAEKCQRKALTLDPGLAVAHANLGTLLRRKGMVREAVPLFRRAVELDPQQPVARFNLSLDHLAEGRLVEGWEDYEERFRARQRQSRRGVDAPAWEGDMLEGRHLLIWPEQGVGDEILFASILPDLEGLDGPVTVECDARLVPLFARSFPHLRVAASGTTKTADYQIPAGSLPRLARRHLTRFPGRPWLVPDAGAVARWRAALSANGPALTVGFCWRSGLKSGERRGLYPTLADFAPLFALPGIRWVPLQYDLADAVTAAELAAGLPHGVDLYRPDIDLHDDLDGVAALTSALDLVVSAGTAVSELAGALGVPVWRIGSDDDWTRLGVGVRPWYPTTRCFQAGSGQSFTALLAGMAHDLCALLPSGKAAAPAASPPPDALPRAMALHKAGRLEPAMELYRKVLAVQPDEPVALHLLGHALVQSGQAADGVPFMERAVSVQPGYVAALANLGAALRALGRPGDALARYRQAARFAPDNPLITVNVGLCQMDQGDLTGAAKTLSALIRTHPDLAPAHDALGLVRMQAGDMAGAMEAHRAAVTADPRLLSGWVNLAAACKAAYRFADAVHALRSACDLAPDRVEGWASLGYALYRQGDVVGAQDALERALALVPDYIPALIDRAQIWSAQARPDQAVALLDRALSIDPGNLLARWNRSLLDLNGGRLPRGWHDYAVRFAVGEVVPDRRFALPPWRGEDLAGKRLLVWREQGLGDEILFLSQIPDLLSMGAQLIIECDRRLVGLLSRSFSTVEVRAETDDPRDADFHCALGDLPARLRLDYKDFAGSTAWLRPDPVLSDAMAARLDGLPPGLRVGFCWRSQKLDGDRADGYLSLAQMLPLLTVPGIVPVSLQYDGAVAEIEALARDHGVTLHRIPDIDLKDDLEAAAALTAGLDLVISAPTAVGEMAAALGVPVWRFQSSRDWSGLGTGVRPWYPWLRIFLAAPVVNAVVTMRGELLDLLALPGTGGPHAPPSPSPLTLEQAVERQQAGDLTTAEAAYRSILRGDPQEVDALHLLSQVLLRTDRAAEGLTLVDQALALDPDFAPAHNTRGSLLKHLERFPAAERAFRQALALRPAYAEAWTNLGAVLVDLKRPADAEKAHRRALAQRADYPRAQVNLGMALRQLGRYAEAVEWHKRALNTAPGMADAWSDLGLCQAALGGQAEGLASQDRALQIDPSYAEAAVNRALLLARQGDVADARADLGRALTIRPGYARALYNDGLLALGTGDLGHGWIGQEARFDSGEVAWGNPPAVQQWQGEPLAGRHLLVWREQGLGDETMFASHYHRLAGMGGPVTIWSDPRLIPALSRALPFARVVPEGTLVTADCHVAAGSLPHLIAPDIADWDGAGFLSPAADLARLWRDRLAGLPPGLRVGLCWRSQLSTADRAAAYTSLSDWLPLLTLSGVQVVSLQYDGGLAEITAMEAAHGVRLHRWDGVDLRDDLETALALTAGLDLVISVATAVGEMAGALGVPVWRLSGPMDWTRLGTGVRPWFSSMQVIDVPLGHSPAQQVPDLVRRLAALRPDAQPDGDPAGWLERGIERQRGGDARGAMPFYRAVIGREGEQPVALHLLGLALQQTGQARDGEAYMERAVAAAPDYAAAWVNLGNLRQALDRPEGAEAAYRQALSLRPRDAGTWTNLGNALRAQRRFDAAAKAHGRAIGFDPQSAVAHGNLAVVWKEMDRPAQAAAEYHQALNLGGEDTHLRAGLGDVLRIQGDLPGARRELAQALALAPDNAEAWNNLGRVAEMAGDAIAARRDYERALDLSPGMATARYNRGRLDLNDGALGAGWDGYAFRFRGEDSIRGRRLSLPAWDGGDLTGKRLLVWGEQGLGDEIMFAALYPALVAASGHLVIEGDPRLSSLFARAFPTATVRGATDDPRDADLAVAAGDVGGRIWRRLEDQMPRPYLSPRADLLAGWRDRLAALGPGLKIGICWRSGLMTAERRAAYATLRDFAPLAALPGVTLVDLQRQATDAEWQGAGFPVARFPDLDLTDDLEGQAALIAALDLVVTAPTAVGELAGALGVPVWRLGAPDWTSLGTGVRPWFPSMRLIDGCGGLQAALEGVARDLPRLRQA